MLLTPARCLYLKQQKIIIYKCCRWLEWSLKCYSGQTSWIMIMWPQVKKNTPPTTTKELQTAPSNGSHIICHNTRLTPNSSPLLIPQVTTEWVSIKVCACVCYHRRMKSCGVRRRRRLGSMKSTSSWKRPSLWTRKALTRQNSHKTSVTTNVHIARCTHSKMYRNRCEVGRCTLISVYLHTPINNQQPLSFPIGKNS